MKNKHHAELLVRIQKNATQTTQHTSLDTYLGTQHKRYPIAVPVLRVIAKDWMKQHTELTASAFSTLLTSLVQGESYTEKCMAGILLDYSTQAQRQFKPQLFDHWLNHLEGWAEIDTLCTSRYTSTEIVDQWKSWKDLLAKFSTSKNIGKRRASLVLLCSPLRTRVDEQLAECALQNVEQLKNEKNVLITKAISWVLRTMIKHHKKIVEVYLKENSTTLPNIAVREAGIKLRTGKKSG